MEVPDNWLRSESDGLIELQPPSPVGAIHMRVLTRTRDSAVRQGEAALLAADFARKQGAAVGTDRERTANGQLIASLSFVDTDASGPRYWDVQVRVWRERALVCSYCHDGLHVPERQQALAILSSIIPAPHLVK
jgi:hypothetical protein